MHTLPAILFFSFFTDKIVNIRHGLEVIQEEEGLVLPDEDKLVVEGNSLQTFEIATEEEVKKIITSSASKQCLLDPIPTYLLKDCITVLLPIITNIINLSLDTASVPECFKIAAVTPLLKKQNLDINNFKNYRPVSNLSFLSKILEKVVSKRMVEHKDSNNLYEKFQSAYRKCHSTETALIRIQNDLLLALDSKQCVFLILLDLSAAFDTVDHTILVKRLNQRLGIQGGAIKWIQSYLDERKQFVIIQGERSAEHVLDCDVPQGSVLGPGMFGDYDSPVGDIFHRHGIQFHLYADDTQVYVTFKPGVTEAEALSKLEACLSDVRKWKAVNFLKLNDEKTDFLILGTKHHLSKIETNSIRIGEANISPNDAVCNIGATFDPVLKLNAHVTRTCKSAWFSFHKLSKIKRFLNFDQQKMAVHALVTSRLDQNNSLLVGLPKTVVTKLQHVQNAAARMLVGAKKFDSVTIHLKNLHWLPIEHRITFKILLLVYKALNDQAPAYLQELLLPYHPARNLRSATENLLIEARTSTSYGDRAFSVAGPKLWNSLPSDIKNCDSLNMFKRLLKTHLFRKAFKC